MPAYRCEFNVIGDLVFDGESSEFELTSKDGFRYTFCNAPNQDADGNAANLVATIIGDFDSIDNALGKFRNKLAVQLDYLAFTTQFRFKIGDAIRLLEWEPGQRERRFKSFHTADTRYPPEPAPLSDFFTTANSLERLTLPGYVGMALRYFRYGLLDEQPEDQFMRFWLSLEIVAENFKDNNKVPIECPTCNTPLTCSCCNTNLTRVPMAKQAITKLISKLVSTDADEVIRRQFIARNGLMHGGSIESIEKKCSATMAELADELSQLAWYTILSVMPPLDLNQLSFSHPNGGVTNNQIITAAYGSFQHSGEGEHPLDEKIPSITITPTTRFGPCD